jgi:hypothetical protein
MISKATANNAARLISKALAPRPNPTRDEDYRELLRLYADDYEFKNVVDGVALGLELKILYGTSHGMVLGTLGKDSRCGVRLTDINTYFGNTDKAALIICFSIMTIAFYPTAQDLDDQDFNPQPQLISDIVYVLNGFIERFSMDREGDPESEQEFLSPGWRFLSILPDSPDGKKKGGKSSKAGLLYSVAKFLETYGYLEIDEREDGPTLNATLRYKIHAKELMFSEIFMWLVENKETDVDNDQAVTDSQKEF